MKERSDHRILVIDEVHEVFIDKLNGLPLDYLPNITIEELPNALFNATILVLRSKLKLDQKWIDLAPKLELIGRLGSGMDNIDVDYANQKGIICLNAPEGNRNAVAEQTIGMMLSLLNNVVKANDEISQGKWLRKQNEGLELKNLTVGIIGYGNVGKELAAKLHIFGCEVLAYDKYLKDFTDDIVKEVNLKELQQKSDVITLHVPLNESSKYMVDQGFINGVSKPFYLLNLSRGQVVNIPDLILHLKGGKVLAAGLDVLPNEDLSSFAEKEQKELEFLTQNPKVILTPHTGGLTKDSFKLLAEVLANKISAHIHG
jgi:D-3-phosphoglycerate dehydrogenase